MKPVRALIKLAYEKDVLTPADYERAKNFFEKCLDANYYYEIFLVFCK